MVWFGRWTGGEPFFRLILNWRAVPQEYLNQFLKMKRLYILFSLQVGIGRSACKLFEHERRMKFLVS
jgi:hypothetical protein